MDKISIQVPANSIYIKSIRLFTSSIASDMDFDIEKIEDIRVVVSEALNYKLNQEDIRIDYFLGEDELKIDVYGRDRELDQKAYVMRDLILKELADECSISEEKISITLRTK